MSAIIDELVALIRGARYGRDVRESIAHGIEVIDDVAEGARDSATASATAAQGYAQSADQSASNAHTSETNAGASATTASQKATLSESWAVGGTGTRSGEDTNNAKYWSEQAEGAVTGVTSFNGRRGAVVPTTGDYSITQIDGSGTAGKVAVTDGNGHMVLTDTGQANGIASLDGNGRVPYTQLPESAMEFKGTWNASTNTPTLTSGVGDSGDFYVVSVGGTWNNIDFNVNDRIIFDGVTAHDWIRLVAGEVNSVNGQSGQVQLDAEDIPFDKKTSPLTSTDTNSAILEVLQKAGVQVVSTTMADYLAHKSEYDASGNLIDITDSGVANSAGNVSYDNTNSDLESVTVQGAIDEINSNLGKMTTLVNNVSCAVTNTYNYVGVSFTLLKRSIVKVRHGYDGAIPHSIGVKASDSGTAWASNIYGENTDNDARVGSLDAYGVLEAGTYYVWAKGSTAGTNNITVIAYQLSS